MDPPEEDLTEDEPLGPLLRAFEEGLATGRPPWGDPALLQLPPQQLAEFLECQDALLALQALKPARAKSAPPSGWPHIPGYEILGVLGRGGMGVVYQARHLALKRLVALKMILAGAHAGPEQLARFQAEAEAVARLTHPNIVQIYEVGNQGGLPYFALEYVDGGSLDKLLQGTPQNPRAAAQLIMTLAQAMHAAHQAGIIHRDLKPANILLQIADCGLRINEPDQSALPHQSAIRNPQSAIPLESAIPKVTDFGLAKQLDSSIGQTQSGAIMGTPSYMAPEQAAGKIKEISPATDVYALGAILYEMLTGRAPFTGQTPLETLHQVCAQEPVPPRRLCPHLPGDLETICLKCLAKAPEKRYASAEALADDLGRFGSGQPIHARPVGWLERTWKLARRRPALASLVVVAMLVLATGPAVLLWLWQQQQAAAQAADRAGRHRYFHALSLADREWLAGNVRQAEATLAECPEALRAWEWRHLKRRCHAETLTLRGHTDGVRGVAYSADGRFLATVSDDGTVRLWDGATGQELRTLARQKLAFLVVSFCPGGSRFAAGGGLGEVLLGEATGDREPVLLGRLGKPVNGLAFSLDGRLLAAIGGDASLKIWDVASGQEMVAVPHALPGPNQAGCSVAFSPDGEYLALAGRSRGAGAAKVWHWRNQREVFAVQTTGRYFGGVVFSPDGQTLVVTSAGLDNRTPIKPLVKLYDWRTGQERRALPGFNGNPETVVFRPDGRQIAFSGSDGTVRLWDATTGEEQLVLRIGGKMQGLAFSPDGNRLATTNGEREAKIWDTTSDQGTVTFGELGQGVLNTVTCSRDGTLWAVGSGNGTFTVRERMTGATVFRGRHEGQWKGVLCLAFHPDGIHLASAAKESQVKIWDVRAGKEVLTLDHAGVRFVQYSPDGRKILTGGDDKVVKVWDAATGQHLLALEGHSAAILSLAFHPNGLQAASTSMDQTVRLWDLANAREVHTLRGHKAGIHGLCFSPVGHWLASGSDDRTVKVWDSVTGAELATLRGHLLKIAAVAVSPDGQRLATASDDRTVKIWDPTTGVEVLTLTGHKGGTTSVAFDPQGHFLASTSWDGTVRFWDGRPWDE